MLADLQLAPDPRAKVIVDNILNNDRVMREVVSETLESARRGVLKESGRTFCPSMEDRVRGPAARFPRAVELSQCPVGAVGLLHTHVTPEELSQPKHSLPDIANVVFRDVDASVIAGTQQADVLVAAQNREAMQRAYQDALGVSVTSTADVVNALGSGQVPDPTAARRDVRNRFATLFRTVPTAFTDLEREVNQLQASGEVGGAVQAAPLAARETLMYGTEGRKLVPNTSKQVTHLSRSISDVLPSDEIKSVAIGTIVGQLVGNLTDRLLFGGP